MVFLTLLYGHAEISDVIDFSSRGERCPQGGLPVWIERAFRQKRKGGVLCIPSGDFSIRYRSRPLIHAFSMIEGAGPAVFRYKNPLIRVCGTAIGKQGILKRPVPDHFRIQPSVGRVVDIFKK